MLFRYLAIALVACLELILPSPFWAIVSLSLFIWFVLGLYKVSSAGTGIMFSLYIQKFLILVSLVFISLGYRMPELGRTADGSVYSGYFCLLVCMFMHISIVTFRGLSARLLSYSGSERSLAFSHAYYFWPTIAFAFISMFYLLLVGGANGFALLSGTDRFVYRAGQGWLFNVIVTAKPLLTAAMGFVRFRLPGGNRASKRALDLTLIALSIIFVLFGDKFLSLIILIAFYFLPWLLGKSKSSLAIPRAAIVMVSLLGLAGLLLTYFVYSRNGQLDYAATSRVLFGRFTGQGQLWYVAMQQGVGFVELDHGQLSKILQAVASRNADVTAFNERTGVFFLISKFAPSQVWTSIVTSKGYVQFTGALEPFFLLAGGHLGLIAVLCVCGVAAGVSAFYVYSSYIHGRMFGFVAGIFILLKVYVMLNQGAVWTVFGWWAAVYIIGLVGIDMLGRTLLANMRPSQRSLSQRSA